MPCARCSKGSSMGSKRCARCRVTILPTDFTKGLAAIYYGEPYCIRCVDPSHPPNVLRRKRILAAIVVIAVLAAGLLIYLFARRFA